MHTHPESVSAQVDEAQAGAPRQHWLLLTHHVPPQPAYLRVKIRRQLQRIGAVPLKNSVYVLPPGDETREDFEWLCRDIERGGGETTLCLAAFLDESTDARIVESFRRAREAEYRAIEDAAGEVLARIEEEHMKGNEAAVAARTGKLRRTLSATNAIDFFGAPGRGKAERAVAHLESRATRPAAPLGDVPPGARPGAGGRTWVTRRGVKVDRMASAWLIARFIDGDARFKFVPASGYAPAEGEIRFDMFDGEYTHDGERCTYETLLARFGLDDPALVAVGEIVHDIDCKDEKFGRAEVPGIASLVDGITRVTGDDDERLRRGAAVFEGLYEHFRSR